MFYEEFGIKKYVLFETIGVTYSEKQNTIIPNAASIGARIINNRLISIKLYHKTKTYQNLKNNKILSVNLIDNVYLFALSSLKDGNQMRGIPHDEILFYYKKHQKNTLNFPYLKNSWGMFFCKFLRETIISSSDKLGLIIASEIELEVIETKKIRQSYKIYNRAENLVLEAIILATRLKVAKNNEDLKQFSQIKEKINDQIKQIESIDTNNLLFKTIDHIKKYILFIEKY